MVKKKRQNFILVFFIQDSWLNDRITFPQLCRKTNWSVSEYLECIYEENIEKKIKFGF